MTMGDSETGGSGRPRPTRTRRLMDFDQGIEDALASIAAAQLAISRASKAAFDGGAPLIDRNDGEQLGRAGTLLSVAAQLLRAQS